MASFTEAKENPVEQLWDEIDDIHAGMLGLMGGNMHMQPMAPNADRKRNAIWFFTKTDSHLVQALRPAAARISASSARITTTTHASLAR